MPPITPLTGPKIAKIVGVFAASVAAFFGAITAISSAWPVVEPYVLAHRGYVHEQVGGVQTTTNELLIWKFEDIRNRAKAEADSWRIQLQKEPNGSTRDLIERRIEALEGEQREASDRIRTLRDRKP